MYAGKKIDRRASGEADFESISLDMGIWALLEPALPDSIAQPRKMDSRLPDCVTIARHLQLEVPVMPADCRRASICLCSFWNLFPLLHSIQSLFLVTNSV